MSNATLTAPITLLPWASSRKDDYTFNLILVVLLGVMLMVAVAVPLIKLPEIERAERKKLPPQLARVVLEKKELPKPKPPEPVKPKEQPEVVKKPPEIAPVKPPPEAVKKAREQAQKSGLLLLQDDLAAMRDAFDIASVSNAGMIDGGNVAAATDRSVIANKAGSSSGGVNVASLNRAAGDVALAGRQQLLVSSEIVDAAAQQAALEAQQQAASGRDKAARSEEDIRKIMERNKGAIFAIYHRALRKDPMLQGKLTIKMVIAPSGAVTEQSIVSSELNAPAIEARLLARIAIINFGAADVVATTLNYTFDFLPR